MARGRCHAAPLRVQSRAAAQAPGASGNHLGLTVRFGQADEEGGEGGGKRWLVDVGLGDGPPYPLALVPGTYAQEGFEFRLRPSPLVAAGLASRPRSARGVHPRRLRRRTGHHGGVRVDAHDAVDLSGVGVRPTAAVLRRPAGGPEMLRGCVFSEWDGDRMRERDVDSAADWWDLVLDRFGLAYADLTALRAGRSLAEGAFDTRSLGCGRPAVTRPCGRAPRYACSRRSPHVSPCSPLLRSTSRTAGRCRGSTCTSRTGASPVSPGTCTPPAAG